MSTKVAVNGRTVVHAGSGGMVISFPDVCLTPTGAGPIPVPYPNLAQSSDAAQTAVTVSADGNGLCHAGSTFSRSSGDEAGSAGGVLSGRFGAASHFVTYSFDVTVEGQGVVRALDLATANDRNTPPFPIVQPPLPGSGTGIEDDAAADWDLIRGRADDGDET